MSVKGAVNKLFPEGTRRRRFIRFIARAIKSLTPTNIKKMIKIIRLYGIKYAFQKAHFYLQEISKN